MGKSIKLGRTMHGETVFAEIEIRDPENGREVQYTDHTFGKLPREVGIMFAVIGKGAPSKPLDEIPDGWWRQAGQVPPEDRVIVTEKHPDLAFIEECWDKWHLNNTNAACDHMTPEMMSRREGENTHDWQGRMLSECKCPVTGYTWGHAWLARRVPDEVIERLNRIVQAA